MTASPRKKGAENDEMRMKSYVIGRMITIKKR